MPTPADSLSKMSVDKDISRAISDSIEMLMKEGRTQEQAIAIAYSQAEKATGRNLSRRSTTIK